MMDLDYAMFVALMAMLNIVHADISYVVHGISQKEYERRFSEYQKTAEEASAIVEKIVKGEQDD